MNWNHIHSPEKGENWEHEMLEILKMMQEIFLYDTGGSISERFNTIFGIEFTVLQGMKATEDSEKKMKPFSQKKWINPF